MRRIVAGGLCFSLAGLLYLLKLSGLSWNLGIFESERPLFSSSNEPTSMSMRTGSSSKSGEYIKRAIPDISKCKYPVSSKISTFMKEPLTRYETQSYLLPEPSDKLVLTEKDLDESTIFSFIHINKAGGTLMKEEIFKSAAFRYKWDGVGFGSTIGWKQLVRGCSNPVLKGSYPADEAVACGESAQLSPCGPVGGGKCPLRLIWGTHAMGLCDLHPDKPCVMTVILREPVERMISQYNYVCVDGKEGQKKWSEEWKQMGRCPLSLLQFMQTRLSSSTFLIDHLARTADPSCGATIALQNLLHPCVRFLLLDRLSNGLERLANTWGPKIQPFMRKVLAAGTQKKNHAGYPARMRTQMDDPIIMNKVRELLKTDIDFYEQALEHYESQWDQPLQSCSNFRS